jgi:hypothetical protein
VYGGRRLLARELNGLTKACVSPTADFDASGGPDVAQVQARTPDGLLERWAAFSYFVELHTSRYEDDARALVIEERSRCTDRGTPLPLGYADGASPYFRECARQRDARYDQAADAPGFDFAQWSCDATQGSCPVPAPPIPSPIGVDVAQQDIPAHGLCNSSLDWKSAGFMGMGHHSQFKCVMVSGDAERDAYERPRDAFHYIVDPDAEPPTETSGYLDFQTCGAAESTASNDPSFECTVGGGAPTFGQVGWAAVRYTDAVDYEGASELAPLPGEPSPTLREVAGCIDEYTWAGLCSLEAFAARAGRNPLDGDWASFGELLHCGPVVYVWSVQSDPGPALPQPEKYLLWAGDVGGALWE